jgi:predicted ATPase
VDTGLPLYGKSPKSENSTLYGSHDTKVCGLAHRGLSLWFRGQPTQAVAMLSEAKSWALQGGHVGSIAHAYNNCAMLNCYRRDFSALREDIANIHALTQSNKLPALAATAEIFEGWCVGIEENPGRGAELIRSGIETHKNLQTPEDYPVYCSLLAEIMVRTGEFSGGVKLLQSAIEESETTGHVYWLGELHRRKAQLMMLSGSPESEIVGELTKSLVSAAQHGAVPILLSAHETLIASRLAQDLAAQYRWKERDRGPSRKLSSTLTQNRFGWPGTVFDAAGIGCNRW